MLGNALFSELSKFNFDVFGTARNAKSKKYFNSEKLKKNIISGVDILKIESVKKVIKKVKPNIVLNCVGLIKQMPTAEDAEMAIYMNALFPHLLAKICRGNNARMIHFSTDCVFSGKKGNYKDDDFADAEDIYGRTKYLGEVKYDNCITLRTSIIGHGFENHLSLVDWFLSQKESVKGFSRVIYSGFPTVEIARIIKDFIIPNNKLSGIYNVSSDPISKYELLKIISKVYGKKIEIVKFDKEISDRTLDSSKFRKLTGCKPPKWDDMINKLHKYYLSNQNFIQY